MKRHEKPYGCTFEGCNGSFGSKNDWKRHENSQHFQLDIWRCDEKADDASGGVCAKFYHRRESFKNHLKKCHGIDDSKIVDDKMNSCRMDCSRQTQFWCGFCRTIISSNKNGLSAWNERYNHIEAHLQGRGCEKKEMKDWQRDDEDSLEADTLASGSVDGGGESAPETTRDNTTAATNTAGDLAILHESLLARKRAGDGDSPACKRAKESDSPSSRRLRNGDSPVPEREVDNGGLRRFWLCVRSSSQVSRFLLSAINHPSAVRLPQLYGLRYLGLLFPMRKSPQSLRRLPHRRTPLGREGDFTITTRRWVRRLVTNCDFMFLHTVGAPRL